jgi:hypothetical protein
MKEKLLIPGKEIVVSKPISKFTSVNNHGFGSNIFDTIQVIINNETTKLASNSLDKNFNNELA